MILGLITVDFEQPVEREGKKFNIFKNLKQIDAPYNFEQCLGCQPIHLTGYGQSTLKREELWPEESIGGGVLSSWPPGSRWCMLPLMPSFEGRLYNYKK